MVFENLKKVEEMRKTLSVRHNNVVKRSGAIVMKEPKLRNIFWGSLWKMSTDLPTVKNLKDVLEFKVGDPWITFSDENLLTKDCKKLVKSLKKYFTLGFSLKKDVEELVEQIKKQVERVTEIIADPEKAFEGQKLDPFKTMQ